MNLLTGVLFILVVDGSVGIELNRLHNRKITSLSRQKREDRCGPGKYFAEKHCCRKCEAGTYAKSDCTAEDGEAICEPCINGQDYMDNANGYPECIKCDICDTFHGFKQLSPCIVTQNTRCKCQDNHFCNSTGDIDGSCNKCLRCTKCNHGVREQCTQRKDSVCEVPRNHLWILAPILCIICFLPVCLFLGIRKCNQQRNQQMKLPVVTTEPDSIRNQNILPVVTTEPEPNNIRNEDVLPVVTTEPEPNNIRNEDVLPLVTTEPEPNDIRNENVLRCPPELEDIDLRPHLPYFADEMSFDDTLGFARKIIRNKVDIEDIATSPKAQKEKKYDMWNAWYQENGRHGAFKVLVYKMVESGKRDTAERLVNGVKQRELQLRNT